jgi:hypothetical protein
VSLWQGLNLLSGIEDISLMNFLEPDENREIVFFHPLNYIIGVGAGQINKKFQEKFAFFFKFCIIYPNLVVLAGQGFNPPSLSPFRLFSPYPRQPALLLSVLSISWEAKNKVLSLSSCQGFFDIGVVLAKLSGRVSDLSGYRKMYLFAGMILLLVTVVFSLEAPFPKKAYQLA